MKKKLVTLLTTSAVILSTVVTPLSVNAEDLSGQLESAQQQVQQLQKELSNAENELAAITTEIEDSERRSQELSEKIAQTQGSLEALQGDIARLEDVIAKRTEKLETQARAEQTENTFENYLGVILNSESLIDALERLNAISQLVSAGTQMREQQIHDKEDLVSKQGELENTLSQQSQAAEELSQLQEALVVKKADQEVYAAQVALDKATAESDVTALQERKAAAEQAALAAREQATRIATEQAAAAAQVAQTVTTLPTGTNTSSTKSNVTYVNTAAQKNTQSQSTVGNANQTASTEATEVVANSSKGSAILAAAMAQLGRTQDCTMLVTNALKAVGINYHNWPIGYMSLGTVVPASQAQPGDLIYYANGGSGLAHIAVYAGNGKAVHGGWNGNQTVVFSAYVGSGPVFIRVK